MVISVLLALREYHTGRPAERPPERLPNVLQPAPNASPNALPHSPGKPPSEQRSRRSDATANTQPTTPERSAVISYAMCYGLTSQAAVAKAIGLHPARLSEWINGKAGNEQAREIEGKLKGS